MSAGQQAMPPLVRPFDSGSLSSVKPLPRSFDAVFAPLRNTFVRIARRRCHRSLYAKARLSASLSRVPGCGILRHLQPIFQRLLTASRIFTMLSAYIGTRTVRCAKSGMLSKLNALSKSVYDRKKPSFLKSFARIWNVS
jgi:hypothetical protein